MGYQEMADQSNGRARRLGIDPPREGRKTYAERYGETSAQSTEAVKAAIDANPGGENGVRYQVLADRGE